jgi:hypothetical protein
MRRRAKNIAGVDPLEQRTWLDELSILRSQVIASCYDPSSGESIPVAGATRRLTGASATYERTPVTSLYTYGFAHNDDAAKQQSKRLKTLGEMLIPHRPSQNVHVAIVAAIRALTWESVDTYVEKLDDLREAIVNDKNIGIRLDDVEDEDVIADLTIAYEVDPSQADLDATNNANAISDNTSKTNDTINTDTAAVVSSRENDKPARKWNQISRNELGMSLTLHKPFKATQIRTTQSRTARTATTRKYNSGNELAPLGGATLQTSPLGGLA